MNAVLLAVLSGGVGAAVVKLLGDLMQRVMERREQKNDAGRLEKERREKEDAALLHATADGVKWMLYDRIRYLGTKYVEDRAVDFDDRRILREMHKVYHYGLGGNGDLDIIMAAVDALPQRQ